ncbi:MAG: acetoin dehydrogenase, partial [Thermoleophilia bacterium]|nr:acetoin dehydrogenase [Thermoleophilia bacterium]
RPPRRVLVTGASSGIGRATAVELARRGAVHLVLVARREADLAETARLAAATARPGLTVELRPCDLADRDAVAALVAELAADPAPLHALVNNAGTSGEAAFEDPASVPELDRMLELNLRTPMVLVQGLVGRLEASGGAAIVNVSSVAGLVGTPQSIAYSTTKWGLTGFSEALRARLAARGVRVVAVHPGPVPTPGWPQAWLDGRPVLRRIVSCDAETIARTIADAVDGRGGPAPVRPRTFALLPVLRGIAPWLVRALLARSARRDPRFTRSTAQEAPR